MPRGTDPTMVDAARTARAYLAELVGDEFPIVDEELVRLLALAAAGEDVTGPLVERLARPAPLRDWTAGFLEEGRPMGVVARGERGIKVPPGAKASVEAIPWECPHGDFVWYSRSPSERPPACPSHRLALVPGRAHPGR